MFTLLLILCFIVLTLCIRILQLLKIIEWLKIWRKLIHKYVDASWNITCVYQDADENVIIEVI